jgi:hypothetical protein
MDRVGFVEVVVALARNSKLTPTFTGDNVALAAAARGQADEGTLLELAASDLVTVHLMMVETETLSDKVFERLAESSHQEVLDAICARPDAPELVLERLILKASSQTLWKLASAANSSGKILKLLSTNKADSVRRAVAVNTSTPTEVLEVLALDPAWAVREKVISNPSASDSAKALAALQV